MELRQLRQFVTLSETLNFHRAAEALNIAQPPLSVSIRKLEAELGGPLFRRHARGVLLTEAGRAALGPAKQTLASADATAAAFKEALAGRRGAVAMGFVASATYALIPAIVRSFRESHPMVELRLREATSHEIARAVEAGDLDVGIVRTPLLLSARVRLEEVCREPLIILTPKSHWLSKKKSVALEDLSEERFVAYDRARAANMWTITMGACERAGFLPTVVEETAHIHTLIALVESGIGIGFAPSIMRGPADSRVHCMAVTLRGRPIDLGTALVTRPGEADAVLAAFTATGRREAVAISSAY